MKGRNDGQNATVIPVMPVQPAAVTPIAAPIVQPVANAAPTTAEMLQEVEATLTTGDAKTPLKVFNPFPGIDTNNLPVGYLVKNVRAPKSKDKRTFAMVIRVGKDLEEAKGLSSPDVVYELYAAKAVIKQQDAIRLLLVQGKSEDQVRAYVEAYQHGQSMPTNRSGAQGDWLKAELKTISAMKDPQAKLVAVAAMQEKINAMMAEMGV